VSASSPAAANHIQPVQIARVGPDSLLTCAQWVPHAREQVFEFFGDAYNLERITPPFLHFAIRDVTPNPVRAGSRIRYRLRLHGLPVFWTTLIDAWNPPVHFRDVQIRGPFAIWEHDHEFVPEGEGTRLFDRVRYRPYLRVLQNTPVLGWIDGDVRRIFAYRQKVIADLFGDRRQSDT
jgi:ligand-binding SRPBCC domain-containing protein